MSLRAGIGLRAALLEPMIQNDGYESQTEGFTGGCGRGTEEALDGVDPDLVQSPRDPPALQQASAPGKEDRARGQNHEERPLGRSLTNTGNITPVHIMEFDW